MGTRGQGKAQRGAGGEFLTQQRQSAQVEPLHCKEKSVNASAATLRERFQRTRRVRQLPAIAQR